MMNENSFNGRGRWQSSSAAGTIGVGQGGLPRGGGRGRCFGGGHGERVIADAPGRGRCRRGQGSPWDLVAVLERRIADLEARVGTQPGTSGGGQGA
jgi:hypothetical protein